MKKKVIFVGARNFQFFSDELLNSIDILILTNELSSVPVSVQGRAEIIIVGQEYDPALLTESLRFDDCITALNPHIFAQDQNIRIFCNQEAYLFVAERIRDHYQLNSHIVGGLDRFRSKQVMKTILQKHGLRVPNFLVFNKSEPHEYYTAQKQIGKVFIAKPISSVGSRGVNKIENECDYMEFVQNNYSSLEHFEIEEFIDGTLYEYDFAVRDGEVLYSAVSQYSCPMALLQKGRTLASIKVKESSWEYETITAFGEKCAQALSANNGCFHMEIFISTTQREVIFLEVAARSPGLLTVPAYINWDGFNMYDAELMIQADLPSMPTKPSNWVSKPSFFVVIPKETGLVKEICQPKTTGIFDVTWKVKSGDNIIVTQTNVDNAATALVVCHTEEDARTDFKHITENYTPIIYSKE